MWLFKQWLEFEFMLRLFGFRGAKKARSSWLFLFWISFLSFSIILGYIIWAVNYVPPYVDPMKSRTAYGQPAGIRYQPLPQRTNEEIWSDYERALAIICKDFPNACTKDH
jgi:hypothetical protein